MVLASDVNQGFDYPDGGIFFSILWLFLFVIFLWLLFVVITDMFRDHELSGWAKALWIIFIIIIPYIGILVYIIARGRGMTERAVKAQKDAEDQFAGYVRHVRGGGVGAADELAKLAELRDKGVITDDELATQKAKILG